MTHNPVERALTVKYSPELALRIVELVAEGRLSLEEIAQRTDMPSKTSIYRWLTLYPKFYDAYERARELSAQSLEDEALEYARILASAKSNDFTGTKVQAYNIAMQQLRWSATHRDKARYGTSDLKNTTVPIVINTTLNLGQEGQGPATDIQQSVYTISAVIKPGVPSDSGDPEPDETLDMEPHMSDTGEMAFGVPETDAQELYKPPRGRPVGSKKGPHKSAADALKTARLYKARDERRAAKAAAAAKTQTKE